MNSENKDELFVHEILEREVLALKEELKKDISIDEKSDLIGKINLLNHSQELLRRCSEYDILPRSIWRRIPPPKHEWSEYRVMEDGDTDNQDSWTELEHIRFTGGEVIIG